MGGERIFRVFCMLKKIVRLMWCQQGYICVRSGLLVYSFLFFFLSGSSLDSDGDF